MLDEWLSELSNRKQSIMVIGQDAELHREGIVEVLGDQVVFAPATLTLPRPSELAFLGKEIEIYQDVHELTPNYIQLAEAEAKWIQAQKEKSE